MEDVIHIDISKLKVPDLKRELKARGLSTAGNKNELIDRLQNSLKTKCEDVASVESADDLEEDLLNEDDDEHLDLTESSITDIDSTIGVAKVPKRKMSDSSHDSELKQTKKVILNRDSLFTDIMDDVQKENEQIGSQKQDGQRKIIKLSDLSAKERLEMRAKKFGVTPTSDAKKFLRAERFGNTSEGQKINSNVTINVDTLKQRAERFGTSVSPVISKLNNQERLQKRKERFGIVTSVVSTNGLSSSNRESHSLKIRQRLERFKTVVK